MVLEMKILFLVILFGLDDSVFLVLWLIMGDFFDEIIERKGEKLSLVFFCENYVILG